MVPAECKKEASTDLALTDAFIVYRSLQTVFVGSVKATGESLGKSVHKLSGFGIDDRQARCC